MSNGTTNAMSAAGGGGIITGTLTLTLSGQMESVQFPKQMSMVTVLDMLPDRHNNNIRVRHRIQPVSKWENIKYLASICRRLRRGIPGARMNAAEALS